MYVFDIWAFSLVYIFKILWVFSFFFWNCFFFIIIIWLRRTHINSHSFAYFRVLVHLLAVLSIQYSGSLIDSDSSQSQCCISWLYPFRILPHLNELLFSDFLIEYFWLRYAFANLALDCGAYIVVACVYFLSILFLRFYFQFGCSLLSDHFSWVPYIL